MIFGISVRQSEWIKYISGLSGETDFGLTAHAKYHNGLS